MKKLSLALVALLAFSFVGCQGWLNIDDPDPDPEPEPDPDPEVEAVITLEETSATLHYGETYQIVAECESPITYTSENEYNATVSEDGLVTANFVGSTTITLESESDTQTFEVTVEPVSDLYPEPEIEIGETKESILEKFGTPGAEVEGAIGYQGYSDNAPMLMVMFDEEDLVVSYGVIIGIDHEEDLNTFLSERYMFAQEEEGVRIYMNALSVEDATLFVGSEAFDEEYLMAFYMGNTSEPEPEEKSADIKAILKALGK